MNRVAIIVGVGPGLGAALGRRLAREGYRMALVLGAFATAREAVPDMIAAGEGAIILTGATSSVRGGGWLAFSSAKFALRGLAQSLARELWPQRNHVAHALVDGLIGTRAAAEKDSTEPVLDPDQMANAYFQLTEQDRSAWTLEMDLRPSREKFFE